MEERPNAAGQPRKGLLLVNPKTLNHIHSLKGDVLTLCPGPAFHDEEERDAMHDNGSLDRVARANLLKPALTASVNYIIRNYQHFHITVQRS